MVINVTKADIGFLLGILALAFLGLLFLQQHREKGSYMEVSYDGTALGKISLSGQEETYYLLTDGMLQKLEKEKDMEWTVQIAQIEEENRTGNYNIFMCRNGEVRMIKSNCPDLLCVHHYPVSAAGENIICLPHKVVIAITGEKGKELDGVVY